MKTSFQSVSGSAPVPMAQLHTTAMIRKSVVIAAALLFLAAAAILAWFSGFRKIWLLVLLFSLGSVIVNLAAGRSGFPRWVRYSHAAVSLMIILLSLFRSFAEPRWNLPERPTAEESEKYMKSVDDLSAEIDRRLPARGQ